MSLALLLLAAAGALAQPVEPRDILPPVALQPRPQWPLYVAGPLLAALFAGAALRIRSNRKTAAPDSAGPAPAPHEIALAALAALDGSAVPKESCGRIAVILRDYAGARFGVRAPEATTQELLDRLYRTCSFEPAAREALWELFESCDTLRYSKEQPADEAVRILTEHARAWIEATRLEMPATASSVLFR